MIYSILWTLEWIVVVELSIQKSIFNNWLSNLPHIKKNNWVLLSRLVVISSWKDFSILPFLNSYSSRLLFRFWMKLLWMNCNVLIRFTISFWEKSHSIKEKNKRFSNETVIIIWNFIFQAQAGNLNLDLKI